MGIWDTINASLRSFEVKSVLEILSIAMIIYLALLLLKGTTAMSLLRGIIIVVVGAVILTEALDLNVLSWLLRNSLPALLITIPIIFQAEIRRFLERVGRTGRWPWPGRALYEGIVDSIADACVYMSEKHIGAIIVVERETGLEEYADAGEKVDAVCSEKLLLSIFYPNSALHDGAVVVRGDRVIAAGVTLPLSEQVEPLAGQSDGFHGTRHKAAIGITERTDAVSVVVSEETGEISIAANGRMISTLDGPRMRGILRSLLLPQMDMDRTTTGKLPRFSR
ncbi:MAG: diadenylate cyclase CdaA [Dehalococcoidia bacterium]